MTILVISLVLIECCTYFKGDSLFGPVHREQQDGEADGDVLLCPPARPHLRRALQDGHDRVLQTRYGRQVAREVHRAHAGEQKKTILPGCQAQTMSSVSVITFLLLRIVRIHLF